MVSVRAARRVHVRCVTPHSRRPAYLNRNSGISPPCAARQGLAHGIRVDVLARVPISAASSGIGGAGLTHNRLWWMLGRLPDRLFLDWPGLSCVCDGSPAGRAMPPSHRRQVRKNPRLPPALPSDPWRPFRTAAALASLSPTFRSGACQVFDARTISLARGCAHFRRGRPVAHSASSAWRMTPTIPPTSVPLMRMYCRSRPTADSSRAVTVPASHCGWCR